VQREIISVVQQTPNALSVYSKQLALPLCRCSKAVGLVCDRSWQPEHMPRPCYAMRVLSVAGVKRQSHLAFTYDEQAAGLSTLAKENCPSRKEAPNGHRGESRNQL
jgi:hypothetical protein